MADMISSCKTHHISQRNNSNESYDHCVIIYMTIENYFLKLDPGLLRYIFLKTGNISERSKVCKLFEETVKTDAKLSYKILVNAFGEPCVHYALKVIQLEKRSYPVKIDGLFHAAMRHKDSGLESHIKTIDYNVHALKQYMEPLMRVESFSKLWLAALKNAHPELKALMRKLSFGQNPFDNAELICQFFKDHPLEIQKITSLNLNQQQLKFLPPAIAYFSGLNTLDISHNFLTELPEEIGHLKELTELRISSNSLQSLPRTIDHLKRLKNFQCCSNQLTAFPDAICEMKELKILNLSKNRIDSLPEGIGNMHSLNYLFLESNAFSSLPLTLEGMPLLIGFYLFNNRISVLPDSLCKLQHLKYLSLQNNALKFLPKNMGEIESLHSLFVDGNTLKELPESICHLKHLKALSISDNKLQKLPEGMHQLEKLTFFNYASNPLSQFPQGIQTLPFWSLNPDLFPRLDNGVEQPFLNTSLSPLQFADTYWRLGSKKWKEGIDGKHHIYGPEVYDLGLHGKYAEPGFLSGLEKAFQFLGSHPNHKISAEFYLALHKAACGHFKGKETHTLMRREKVGIFRDSDHIIRSTFPESDYLMTQSAMNEFNDLNGELTLHFGSSFRIGDLILNSHPPSQEITIHYQLLSKEQVAIIFNYFLTEFYYNIGHAQKDEFRIKAIAKFIQRLEWLHPMHDGCGRTDTALLNYLLTCYGFNPVILKFPYVSSCKGLNEWTSLLIAGMQEWRREEI